VSGRGVARLLAVAVAIGIMSTAIGACGGDGNSQAENAAQDRAVASANKAEKHYVDTMRAAIRKKWLARAAARRAAAAHRRRSGATVIVGSERMGLGDICGPVQTRLGGPAGQAERRWRRQQRRKVLGYLNLRCPSLNIPRV
jgi:hypothetical protein